jgi:hypothetical protein
MRRCRCIAAPASKRSGNTATGSASSGRDMSSRPLTGRGWRGGRVSATMDG